MAKTTKIALITAAVLIALGCIAGGFGLVLSGGELGIDFDERERYEERFDGPVARIETGLRSDILELYTVSGDEYIVEYYDNEKNYFDVELDGDTLKVVRNDVKRKWYENIHIGFGSTGPDVRIGVPSAFYGEVYLSANSGGISAKGLTLEKPFTAEVGSGGVSIENVYCSELSISAGSGGINVEDVTSIGDAALTAGSGAVRADTLRCGGVLTAEANSGAVSLENCSAESFSFETNSGLISFEDCAYEDNAIIEAGSGSIKGELSGRMRDYSIRSRTGSGSCNLPDYTESGAKTLEVYTGSGSINIKFDND